MRGVHAGDSLTLVITNGFAKIRQNLGRSFVVASASSINEFFRFAKPSLGIVNHLRHAILTLAFLLGHFAPCTSFPLLSLLGLLLGAKCFGPIQ